VTETPQTIAGPSPQTRWAGLGGILYVVFAAVGLVLSYRGPDTGAAPNG
jgi:hypothetical protein